MTNKERKPSGLLHSADELKQLIAENPELDGWINADYEQPNTARDVLVFEKGVGVSIGFFVDGWHMYGSNDFEIKVTYWRELPDPLSEDEVWQTLSRLVRLKTNENSKIH